MSEQNPGILSHVSLGTNDPDRALRFYDATLATLGIVRLETLDGIAAGYGRQFPEFWIALPGDEKPASAGNGVHIAFIAASREEVQLFHAEALAAGGTEEGAPGPRPEYGAAFYGCFVRDPDGNKIEATFRDENLPGS
ncbi:VOC family protein [Granulosicoccus sp. 3-233]|uniref:VOC family protein n=1 Tax=Granulosicoccus sp. 3-233 TaxID=3417969 RepID=UPI003D33BC5B